jgi:uncharacterized LabA/DUF88 family protein
MATYGRTNFYIDGFNLYYGCLKANRHCRWLNVRALCQTLYPNNEINRIRYFTAALKPMAHDPKQPLRQEVYLRALKTIDCLEIHMGTFLSHRVRMPLPEPLPDGTRTVEVIKTEEKGSDVNLATYLLLDGFRGNYEAAVVISNDSDLVEPIKVVKEALHLPVGVVNPYLEKKMMSGDLRNVATFYKRVRVGMLESCQFPETLADDAGVIVRPKKWRS